jgi:hypothetical protein
MGESIARFTARKIRTRTMFRWRHCAAFYARRESTAEETGTL